MLNLSKFFTENLLIKKSCVFLAIVLFSIASIVRAEISLDFNFSSGDEALIGGHNFWSKFFSNNYKHHGKKHHDYNDADNDNDNDDDDARVGCSDKKLGKGYINVCVSDMDDDDDDGHNSSKVKTLCKKNTEKLQRKIANRPNYFIPITFYEDKDGDGFGNVDVTVDACEQPDGYVDNSTDCLDDPVADANAPLVNPAAADGCPVVDGIDNDCDGTIDEGAEPLFTDEDNDGFGTGTAELGCVGDDPNSDGLAKEDGDCNDTNSAVNPDATEVACDGVDNDCQDGDAQNLTAFADEDGDGFGAPGTGFLTCDTELVMNDEDCNDDPEQGGSAINPDADELCDGIDNNCDEQTDEGYVLGAACDNGLEGVCTAAGETVCTEDGTSTKCDAPIIEPEQSFETACTDLLDNDCDGNQDGSDSDCNGYNMPCDVGVGECNAAGNTTIADIDNQGMVTWQCDATPSSPSPELCDGLDNDCDSDDTQNGGTDEDFDVGDTCSVGQGVCSQDGEKVCTSDGSGTECNATPLTNQTTEVVCTVAGQQGVCASGLLACDSVGGQSCLQQTFAGDNEEVCDDPEGLDEDCDGDANGDDSDCATQEIDYTCLIGIQNSISLKFKGTYVFSHPATQISGLTWKSISTFKGVEYEYCHRIIAGSSSIIYEFKFANGGSCTNFTRCAGCELNGFYKTAAATGQAYQNANCNGANAATWSNLIQNLPVQ